jgi:hypothetical protein
VHGETSLSEFKEFKWPLGDAERKKIEDAVNAGGVHFKMANGLDAVLYSLDNPLVSKVASACANPQLAGFRILPSNRKEMRFLTLKASVENSTFYLVFMFWVEPWRAIGMYTDHFREFADFEWIICQNIQLVVIGGRAYRFRDTLAGQAVRQAIIRRVKPEVAAIIGEQGE